MVRTSEATVEQLRPGDVVSGPGLSRLRQAVFVQKAEHPIYDGLMLVVWKLDDGEWSHDALDPRQVVGEIEWKDWPDRQAALRWALLRQGEPPWRRDGRDA